MILRFYQRRSGDTNCREHGSALEEEPHDDPVQGPGSRNPLRGGAAADGKPETGWAVSPRFGQRHVAVFQCEKPIAAKGGALLEVKLVQPYGSRHTLGRFRISCTATPRPVGVSQLPDELLAALAVAPERRTPEQRGKVFEAYIRGDRDMEERIRLAAAQDLAWALLNSPAFLFNR